MDLLKILVTLSVLLALYIVYSWWTRLGGLGRFTNQYHVLGCYASDTITDYSSQIKLELQKLNKIQAQLDNIDVNDLQWLDQLLPQLSTKLEIFEKSYYESKADNVKSILVQKKLEDAINQHEQCLARVAYHDPQDCESVKRTQNEIKLQIKNNFDDINKLNSEKLSLEQDFEKQKTRKYQPQQKSLSVPKDNEIARVRTILLNTKDKIRDNVKRSNHILQKIQTNKENLDRCAASRQLAKICENITVTLSQFVDEEYHLTSIQERIDMKTKQFNVLKDAIESCVGNCEDANLEADKVRAQLMNLIKIQAQLRQKQAKCKQLCTTDQIKALQLEKNQLESDKLRNIQTFNDLNNQTKELEKQIKDLESQNIVIQPVVDSSIQPNQKLKQISNDIGDVYKHIKNRHANIQSLVGNLHEHDNKFSQHAQNIEILNSCAVLREVAEKLAKQVHDQSLIPGIGNKINLSKSELIRLLDNIKKL